MRTIRLPLMGNQFVGREGIPRYMQYHLCHIAQAVLLVREPDNPRDPNAIVAIAEMADGKALDLGYVPRNMAALLSKDIAAGKSFRAEIVEIRPDAADNDRNVVVLAIAGPEVGPEPYQIEAKANLPIKSDNSNCNAGGSATIINSEESSEEALVPPSAPEHVPQGEFAVVSGWLQFFCITRGVIAPILFIGSHDFSLPLSFMQGLGFADAAANFLIAVLLWTTKPVALTVLKRYFIAFFAVSGYSLVRLILASVVDPSAELTTSISRLFSANLFQLTWYIYFARSKRVLATYGRNI